MIKPDFVLLTDLADQPSDGGDTIIASTVGVITVEMLRHLAFESAEAVGCRLHHAEWVFTTDPDVVRSFGVFPIHDGCDRCEDGVRRAVAALDADPSLVMLVGRLHWVAEPDRR